MPADGLGDGEGDVVGEGVGDEREETDSDEGPRLDSRLEDGTAKMLDRLDDGRTLLLNGDGWPEDATTEGLEDGEGADGLETAELTDEAADGGDEMGDGGLEIALDGPGSDDLAEDDEEGDGELDAAAGLPGAADGLGDGPPEGLGDGLEDGVAGERLLGGLADETADEMEDSEDAATGEPGAISQTAPSQTAPKQRKSPATPTAADGDEDDEGVADDDEEELEAAG